MRVTALYPADHPTASRAVATPAELNLIKPPAHLRVVLTTSTQYNPNWTVALGHAVQRGVSIITTQEEEPA